MKTPWRHRNERSSDLTLALWSIALAAVFAGACEPTPGYLRRWANTEGSEEKFLGYLHDPELSHEVHVTALELLVEQWDYSMGDLAGGAALLAMSDPAERDATLRDAIPRVRELYEQGETWTYKMRDAAFHLRQGTSDPAIQAELDAIMADWLNDHWDPCQLGGGTTPLSQLLGVLGSERAAPRIVEVLREGAFDRVLCFGRDVGSVDWLKESEEVAAAYVDRWESGNVSEHDQLRFEFLEHMLRLNQTSAMRTWMFDQLSDPDTAPLFKNAILDAASDNPTDADVEGYTRLLDAETYSRWAAFEAIVNARGTQGLEHALANLPPTGEYGFYDGQIRADGLRSASSNIACVLPKLRELGDNARRVFERHIEDPNIPVRLLSITCLGTYGDRQTVTRLTAARAALGGAGVPAPGFGEGATIQGVIDDAVEAIQTRLGT